MAFPSVEAGEALTLTVVILPPAGTLLRQFSGDAEVVSQATLRATDGVRGTVNRAGGWPSPHTSRGVGSPASTCQVAAVVMAVRASVTSSRTRKVAVRRSGSAVTVR